MSKKYKVFVSHAKRDEVLINNIVDTLLICGLGLKNEEIFCSSIEGLGIEIGEDWRNEIKETLINSDVILLVITPNFQASEVCLCEMGAAWASNAIVIPAVLAPAKFMTMSTLLNVKQRVCLDEANALDALCQRLNTALDLNINIGRLGAKKRETQKAIKDYLDKTVFDSPLTRENLRLIEAKVEEQAEIINYYLMENKTNAELIRHLERLKDKEEVAIVKKDVGLIDEYDIFKEKVSGFKDRLKNFNIVVVSAIFYHLSRRDLKYDRAYDEEFTKARNDAYIDDDLNLNTNERLIKQALLAYNEFNAYFSDEVKEKLCERIEEEYPEIDVYYELTEKFWWFIFGERIL